MKILHKLRKTLFSRKAALVAWLFFIVFIWTNILWLDSAFAQTATNTDFITEIITLLESVLKIIYMLLWPLLFIAGLAIDNSMIYWEVFWLDQPLWQFWNIMKNFANFSLWFIMLYYILKNIFSPLWENNVFDTIKKIVIATVAIQASWFLVWAVVDISTIMTYSLWTIPMTVTDWDIESKINRKPVFKIHPMLSIDSRKLTQEQKETMIDESYYYYYSYGDEYISPCAYELREEMVDEKKEKVSYIVGRKYVMDTENITFNTDICIHNGRPFRFNESQEIVWVIWNASYANKIKEDVKDNRTGNVADCFFVNPNNLLDTCNNTGPINYKYDDATEGWTDDTDEIFKNNSWLSMESLIEKWWDFIGPFVSLYSSLLDFTELVDTWDVNDWTSGFWKLFLFLIKGLFAVLLVAPLVAVVILLLARVWILWIVIAAIPLLIIKRVFFKDSKSLSFIDDYLSIPEIVKLLFAPVFFVFAVSLSIVFVWLVSDNENANKWMNSNEYMTLSEGWNVEVLWWLIDLSYYWPEIEQWKDFFSWLLVSLMSLWIVWFILFASIKFSKLWGAIWQKVESLSVQAMKNVPILPIPWGSVNAITQVAREQVGKIDNISTKQTARLEEALWIRKPADPKEEDNTNTIQTTSYQPYNPVDYSNYWNNWDQVKDKAIWTTIATWAAAGAVNWDEVYNNNINDLQWVDWIKNTSDLVNTYYWANTDMIWNYDASTTKTENLSDTEINAFMNLNDSWKTWAGENQGKTIKVKTKDWTRDMIVDNLWDSSNPNYKLLTQWQFEKRYFGWDVNMNTNTIQAIPSTIQSMEKDVEKTDNENDKKMIESQIESIKANQTKADEYLKNRIEELGKWKPADPSIPVGDWETSNSDAPTS